MNIRCMKEKDLDFAANCTLNEGWASETRREFEGFFEHDAEGCFIVEEAGRHIGVGIATGYGIMGFIGELIVLRDYRGRGIGNALLDRAIRHLREKGAKNIFLDGVVSAVSLYERAGFRKICRSLRFSGYLSGKPHSHVRNMNEQDLETVCEMDNASFGSDRRFFLKRRFLLYPELCKVSTHDNQIVGYIMGRRGTDLVSFGPWLVLPGTIRPLDLLESALLEVGRFRISIGVLESNMIAVRMIRSLGMVERSDSPWRMILGNDITLGSSEQLYAIGSAAKG